MIDKMIEEKRPVEKKPIEKRPIEKKPTEVQEAEDSALSAAEQERFRRMLEEAEERIRALDEHLAASGIIKSEKPAGNQTGDPADNNAVPDDVPEIRPEIEPKIEPKIEPEIMPETDLGWLGEKDREKDGDNLAAGYDGGYDAEVSQEKPERKAGQKSEQKIGRRIRSNFAAGSWQLLAGFGISFAVRVGFLGIWLGSYVDRRWLGDTGIGAMVIIVLVIFYSFYMLYHDLMRLTKQQEAKDRLSENPAEEASGETDV